MENDVKLTKLASCAGCGAKVGAGTLSKLLEDIKIHNDPDLLVGFDRSDDACVYRINDSQAIVQTLDFFPPIVDDPYTFGQIAAANALSDVYAMGGTPKLALNIMCVPQSMPKSAIQQMLSGGYDKVYEAGALIAGGHSIYDDEPKYGLCVTGFVHPERILKNSGAKPGDAIILTKPLGIGVMTTAHKMGKLSREGMNLCVDVMTTLNKSARDIMIDFKIHACTDVTGFSLLGHGLEMAQGSDATIVFDTANIDFMDEALYLSKQGIAPGGTQRNRAFAQPHVEAASIPEYVQNLLYDPQTSGGLLIAVDSNDAETLLGKLSGNVPSARIIGRVERFNSSYIRVV